LYLAYGIDLGFANINKPKENLEITITTMFPLKKVSHPSHDYFQAY
jgi:hypothetical protein